jgi:hypothetical protein
LFSCSNLFYIIWFDLSSQIFIIPWTHTHTHTHAYTHDYTDDWETHKEFVDCKPKVKLGCQISTQRCNINQKSSKYKIKHFLALSFFYFKLKHHFKLSWRWNRFDWNKKKKIKPIKIKSRLYTIKKLTISNAMLTSEMWRWLLSNWLIRSRKSKFKLKQHTAFIRSVRFEQNLAQTEVQAELI